MSAFLIGYAIKADTATQTRKLVLMKLVDAAEEDGSNVYPSVATIARAAMCSERQVQRVLNEFCGVGLLAKVRDGIGGRGKGRPTEYRIVVDRLRTLAEAGWDALEGAQEATSATGATGTNQEARSGEAATGNAEKGDTMSPISGAEKGDMAARKRVTFAAEKGDTIMSPYPLDPSLNPSGEREGALARAIDLDGEGEEARSGGAAEATGTQTTDAGLSTEGRSVLDMIALYPFGRQYPRGQVEAAWVALSPDERQRAIDELPGWLDERAAAKVRPMFLQTYLADRQFDLPRGIGPAAKPGKAGRVAKGATVSGGGVSFGNYSREWFAHLVWRLERGLPVALMVRTARENRGGKWGCKLTELPTAEALAGFVKLSSDSEKWRAWRRWILGRAPELGDVLPAVDHVMWLELPSEWPPGHQEARSGGAAEATGTERTTDHHHHDPAEA